MIRVKFFSFGNEERTCKQLEDFLNKIGKQKVIQILATPNTHGSFGVSPVTYTLIYEE